MSQYSFHFHLNKFYWILQKSLVSSCLDNSLLCLEKTPFLKYEMRVSHNYQDRDLRIILKPPPQKGAEEEWNQSTICSIFKNKGDPLECKNYRGISLMSHAGKLYERILERRLRSKVEEKLSENQCGFRPGRGTVDQIAALRLLWVVCPSVDPRSGLICNLRIIPWWLFSPLERCLAPSIFILEVPLRVRPELAKPRPPRIWPRPSPSSAWSSTAPTVWITSPSESSSRVWRPAGPGPALTSSTASILRCCLWSPSRFWQSKEVCTFSFLFFTNWLKWTFFEGNINIWLLRCSQLLSNQKLLSCCVGKRDYAAPECSRLAN